LDENGTQLAMGIAKSAEEVEKFYGAIDSYGPQDEGPGI